MGLSASILGASGYTAGELLRLLSSHPVIRPVALGAHSAAGGETAEVHPHLVAEPGGRFADAATAAATAADVCFSCLPSGVLGDLAASINAPLVVDLSDDHRGASGWVYGLTEHARAEIATATRIANPGCYPTAALMGLLPFFHAGLVGDPVVIIDAMSGISGAGKGLPDALSFAALHGSVTAYGPRVHRHVPEIQRVLTEAGGGRAVSVSFTPHLVPIARGLLVTARVFPAAGMDDAAALDVLMDAYADERFVTVTETWPSTKAAAGTNSVLVSARVDPSTGMLIVSSAIDNLGKGAAGQALQNANVALGVDESAGLELVAAWP